MVNPAALYTCAANHMLEYLTHRDKYCIYLMVARIIPPKLQLFNYAMCYMRAFMVVAARFPLYQQY